VQEHDVDVAERIQFGAPVSADGDQREAGDLAEFRQDFFFRRLEDVPQQHVQHGRAAVANLASRPARAVQHLQAAVLQFEESFVTREIVAGLTFFGQLCVRVRFNFFGKARHFAPGS